MSTIYINRTVDEMWLLDRKGLCVFCATDHKGHECLARHCDSCSSDYLSDTGNDGDGRPVTETCPDCCRDGFGSLDETIAWLAKQSERMAAQMTVELGKQFDAATDEVLAKLDAEIDRRQQQTPIEIERRVA